MAVRTPLASLAALGIVLALGACAQAPLAPSSAGQKTSGAQTEEDHAAHHPEGEATAPAAAPTPPPAAAAPAAPMAGMAEHMKAMQAMHEKMSRATTPEERREVMAEHQALMQQCMSMMNMMGGMGGMGGMDRMPPATR